MKLAVFDFEPSFCPACGRKITWTRENLIRYYRDKASFACNCTLRYAGVSKSQIEETVTKFGVNLRLTD